MKLLDWWKIKLRRGAIRMALRRPMPDQLIYGDKRNNSYQVRIGDRSEGFVLIAKAVLPEGIEGWCFVGQKPRTEASLPNSQLLTLPFKVTYYYKGHTIVTESPALFMIQQLIFYPFIVALSQKINQFFFNRTKLARQDRMAILQYMFEQTILNSDFRTSSNDLPSRIYGMRFWGREDHDAHVSYYELVLESLRASGDLQIVDRNYAISPKAVATLDAHATDQERHHDNIGIQRTIAFVSVVLALLAAAQVGTAIWGELHPDPITVAPAAAP